MKPILLLLTAILLAACGLAPASVPIATDTAPLTATLPPAEIPSPAPSPTPEDVATSVENSASVIALSLKYTPEEISSFPGGVTEQEITIGDETQNALVGLQQDGTIDRVLALEINGVMTRVGEWTDAEGHTFYVYVNPDYDPLHRILATEQTPETLTNFLFEALATGQFASQAGGDGNALKTILFNEANAGRVSLDLPVADPENGDWAVKWIPSETKADFSKPIEVMTVFGDDADEFMKNSPLAEKVMNRSKEAYVGGLIWVSEDGHIQIILVQSALENENPIRYIPRNRSEKVNVTTRLKEQVGWKLFAFLKTLEYHQNPDAFLLVSKYSHNQYDLLSRDLFGLSVDLP